MSTKGTHSPVANFFLVLYRLMRKNKTYLIINFQICIMVSRKKQDPTADDMPLHSADMTFTSETANQGQMTTYER